MGDDDDVSKEMRTKIIISVLTTHTDTHTILHSDDTSTGAKPLWPNECIKWNEIKSDFVCLEWSTTHAPKIASYNKIRTNKTTSIKRKKQRRAKYNPKKAPKNTSWKWNFRKLIEFPFGFRIEYRKKSTNKENKSEMDDAEGGGAVLLGWR